VRKTAAAMISGCLTLIFSYPFDLIRTRVSLELGKGREDRFYKNLRQTWRIARRTEGFRSLYRGFFLSNAINLPYTLTLLMSYELLNGFHSRENTIWNSIGIVSLCGFLAQSVVYPLDTVRLIKLLNLL